MHTVSPCLTLHTFNFAREFTAADTLQPWFNADTRSVDIEEPMQPVSPPAIKSVVVIHCRRVILHWLGRPSHSLLVRMHCYHLKWSIVSKLYPVSECLSMSQHISACLSMLISAQVWVIMGHEVLVRLMLLNSYGSMMLVEQDIIIPIKWNSNEQYKIMWHMTYYTSWY